MAEISLHSWYPDRGSVVFDTKDLNRPEKLFLVANLVMESNYSDEKREISSNVQDLALRIIDDMNLKNRIETAVTVLSTVETGSWQLGE